MKNYQLGRKVVDLARNTPERFDMWPWAEERDCGIVACLGGWTMLLSGYTFVSVNQDGVADQLFRRPDGTMVEGSYSREAEKLLGFTKQDFVGAKGIWFDDVSGLDRFERFVERSEREAAEAGDA